jgi:1-acyl-sn-glycerol-3-phosphate acyltransferase
MKFIISVGKTLFTILATLFFYGCYAIGFLILKLFRQETGALRNYCLNRWGKSVCKILSIKVEVIGKMPEPPFFLVSNHLSYADIIIFFSVLKTTFVSKAEVKNWPMLGIMARTLEIIFIDRKRKSDVARVNQSVADQISKYKGVVLFPEGTTSSGESLLPFKPSILEHPAKSQMPVHYAYITYRTGPKDEDAINSVCWWNDESFGSHFLKFAGNRSIRARIYFGEETIHKSDRKELAAELFKKVKALQQQNRHQSELEVTKKSQLRFKQD